MEQDQSFSNHLDQEASSSATPTEFTLSPEDIAEMAPLLEGCPPCLEFVESLRATVRLCKEIEAPETPTPLDEKTYDKMWAAYQAVQRQRQEKQSEGS